MSVTDLLSDAAEMGLSSQSDMRDVISNVDLPETLQRSSIVYMFENDEIGYIGNNRNYIEHFDHEYHGQYLKEKCRQIRIIISKLCDKYIFGRGDFQINISYSIKSEFDLLIDCDQNEWIKNQSIPCQDLYTIFDSCIVEMFQLMTHSVRRFSKTKV